MACCEFELKIITMMHVMFAQFKQYHYEKFVHLLLESNDRLYQKQFIKYDYI